jgi:hypothetical protein
MSVRWKTLKVGRVVDEIFVLVSVRAHESGRAFTRRDAFGAAVGGGAKFRCIKLGTS